MKFCHVRYGPIYKIEIIAAIDIMLINNDIDTDF